MAKNKKSKILASMLAVSTMAVFYAAPVMAADVSIWQDTTGNKIDFIVEMIRAQLYRLLLLIMVV